ncbi:MAG TPA: hypothetical protein VK484_12950, partial [Ferruginibacter sp.]|nr:hypothetical protein [Ferruginibacter sp.]
FDLKLKYLDAERAARISNGESTLEVDRQITDARIQLANREAQAKQAALSAIAGALGSFSELAGKETAAGKALAVAQTTIQTYQSATAAFASLASIPVVGPALGAVAAAGAIVAGLVNVKKILSVKVPGKGGSSSGGGGISGGATSYTPPQIPQQSNFTELSPQSINQITKQKDVAQRSYVLESDIADTSNKVRKYRCM